LGGLLWWQNRHEQQTMADLATPAWPAPDSAASANTTTAPQPALPSAPADAAPMQAFVPPTPLPADLRESGTHQAPTASDRAAKKLLVNHSRAGKKRKMAMKKVPAQPAPAPSLEPSPKPRPAAGGPLVQALMQAPGGLGEAADPSQQPAALEVINTRCVPGQHQEAHLAVVAPGPAQVEMRIFTSHSRSVKLVQLNLDQAGRLDLSWNGQDDQGADLPAGIYYARVTTPWFIRTETLELAR
jgi:hypothetical protein